MILINGVIGIGTDLVAMFHCYNPKEIIQIYKKLLKSNNYPKKFKPKDFEFIHSILVIVV